VKLITNIFKSVKQTSYVDSNAGNSWISVKPSNSRGPTAIRPPETTHASLELQIPVSILFQIRIGMLFSLIQFKLGIGMLFSLIHPLKLQIPVSIQFQLRIGMLFSLIILNLNKLTTRNSPLILINGQDSCQTLATTMSKDITGRNPLQWNNADYQRLTYWSTLPCKNQGKTKMVPASFQP
jgi:hypothetical protein